MQPAGKIAERIETWPLLIIISAFWIYVTLSNILFASSMDAGFRPMTEHQLFAPWEVRTLQHVFLYPALLLSVWTSVRIRWQPWWPALPMQAAIAVAFAVLGSPALMAAELTLGLNDMKHDPATSGSDSLFSAADIQLWLASATNMFLAYGFGLALVTGFANYRRYRDSQTRISTLEKQFDAARLSALRMQLSPHTLFNLLHTIHGEIEWQPREAQAMVVKLGDLLRRLLRAGERDFAKLADELQFVRLYLELQQKRFADRLEVIFPAAEPPDVWVPSLILQPLVENAVLHGLAGHDRPVAVRVEASLVNEQLHLRVVNDSVASASGGGEGIGIKNVRERLAVQFGAAASFTSAFDGTGHWRAEILMPALRDAQVASASAAASTAPSPRALMITDASVPMPR